jgi:hypothetical protein
MKLGLDERVPVLQRQLPDQDRAPCVLTITSTNGAVAKLTSLQAARPPPWC